MEPSRAPGRVAFAVVAAASVLALSAYREAPGSYATDDRFYLGAALGAVESGHYAIPVYEGRERLRKPPLHYWLIAASFRLFGVGLWQARLPSALAALLSLLTTGWLAALLFGSRRAALYASGILLASGLFLVQSRSALTDSVLCWLVLVSFAGFAAAERGRRAGLPLAWAGMACACLQKGPVGLALPLGTALVWSGIARPQRLGWRRILDPRCIALFLLIALPWPLLVLSRLGVAGFADPVGAELGAHLGSPLAQLPQKLSAYAWDLTRSVLPWTPLLLLYRRRELRSPEIRWLGLWAGGFALLFSLFVLKHRWRYLLPAIPALALLAGRALDLLQQRLAERPLELRLCHWSVGLWFLAAAIQGVVLFLGARGPLAGSRAPAVAALVVVSSLGAAAIVALLRRRAAPHVWVVAALLGVVLVQTLRSVAFLASVPTAPAYELAKRYLRDRAAPARVLGMGLRDEERSFASLGAGFSLRQLSSVDLPPAPEQVDFILAEAGSVASLAEETRGAFREVARQGGVERDGGMAWRRGDLDLRRARSGDRARPLVLLQRRTADAGSPPR